ncbi:RING ZINC FINGER PROTEIN-RELATED [Salix viminalis]|uniref:RING ZINC FINGER PROTEIN-RELATED n=1 Tax=Salix viminalis TaxID=40686 RepID=A0A9Q0YY74_SALVM|nr:RING ZINC FINGER PROTEIN-RELATED [Salix viminalis]
MGFPVGYSELLLPKLLLHALSVLGLLRKLMNILFHYLVSALLIREILPVVKFSELVDPSADSCVVCLYEFEEVDEIRRLANCRHIFHKCCLDRWMGYDQITCPLCRTPLIPDDMQESFNERFWAASGIPDFYGEYPQIPDL